jgi:protein involved in polysaccharide export with SLBB domain
MSPQDIARQLEASGLSRAQVRDRLRRAGYDPSLADEYFDAIESGASLEGVESGSEFMAALQGIGVQLRDPEVAGDGGMAPGPLRYPGDSLSVAADTLETEPDTVPRVFGQDVFRRVGSSFEPLLTGPVGESYVLGPGDELLLVLTGDVELAYTLNVTREGTLVIPDVGQISVNGLSLAQLRERLFDRLGQVYSGVRRSADATTSFDLSLGRLRTNQIRVLGSVQRPGSYQISSVGTLLEALYSAGGPTEQGSFRRVLVQRSGEEAREVDLYPYLTRGDPGDDPRLQEGDVVFVPPVGPQVTLRGFVRRPAIFELREGEGLPAVIQFAGGLLPDARVDRAQVDRILPPAERAGGVDRVLLDAPLSQVMAGVTSFPLLAGDEVRVFPVATRIRQRVSIEGAVWRPGAYQLRPGSTVGSLVERAGGLREEALGARVLLTRLDLATGERTGQRVDLSAGAGPLLQEFDEVQVFAVDSLSTPDSVAVYGMVKNPGRYPLSEGITAGDLVLLAGGFTPGATPWSAEVVERSTAAGVDREVSVSRFVQLRDGIPYPDPRILGERPDSLDALPLEDEVILQNGDEVFIRRLPGYAPAARVSVEGEAVSPGIYQLTRQDERLSSVLRRAGLLTDAANPEGVRLIRDGIPVGVDYTAAMRRPGSVEDPVLVAGDRIVVPVVDNTVLVTGAVIFESRVVYRDGMSMDDFVAEAGGYAQNADRNRASVEYANGSRATASKTLWLFRNTPDVRPGSVVFVPARPETGDGFNWDQALSRILAVGSTLATIFIAVNR